jgi:hypothetical protein
MTRHPACHRAAASLILRRDLPGTGPALQNGRETMAKGQLRSNKEAKKPKKEKPKVLATAGMTPAVSNPGKKK